MDLKEEIILGGNIESHWYYLSKGQAMLDLLGGLQTSEILDIGAGSGIFSRQLLDHGFCKSAVCVDPHYSRESSVVYDGRTIRFVKKAGKDPQRLILMMDVLEHVTDDLGMLREYGGILETGGHLLITVPAFNFLWSGHDVFLGHYRRYTLRDVERLVAGADLTPVRIRYFFGSLFPAVAGIRLVRKYLFEKGRIQARSELRSYPRWLNRMLVVLHNLERRSVFKVNRLAGLSIFCLCRKEENRP